MTNTPPIYTPYQPYQPIQTPGNVATPQAVAAPQTVGAGQESAYMQSLLSGLGISGPADSRGSQMNAVYAAANPMFDAVAGQRGGMGEGARTRLVGETIAAPAAQIQSNYANMLQNWNQGLMSTAQNYGNRAQQNNQWGAQFEAGQGQWGAQFQAGQNQWGAQFGADQYQTGYDYGMGEHDKEYERNVFNPWQMDMQMLLTMLQRPNANKDNLQQAGFDPSQLQGGYPPGAFNPDAEEESWQY